MNPITQAIAASNVLEALEQSGRIGKYERTTHEIKWDSSMSIAGRPSAVMGDFSYVQISDIVPDMADFANAMIYGEVEGEMVGQPIPTITPIDVGFTFGEEDFALGVVVTKGVAGVAPNGLYILVDMLEANSSFVIKWHSETIHPIDPKFLPGPVVLDLTKYDANGQSLNYLVLSLFTGGGGKTSVDNTDGTQAFWKDVNTDGRIQLMIDATSVKIVSDVKSTTLEPDGKTLVAIETSFLIQSAGQTARVTVMFGALSHTTEITLVVEFLTIPG